MKRWWQSNFLQYTLIIVGSVLFWFAYYYFNSRILTRSLFLATVDTLQYLGGYMFISQLLLPQFVIHRKVHRFLTGFLLLVVGVGALRMYEYKLISDYYDQRYVIGMSAVVYVFTTTTFILGAVSGVRFTIDWLQQQKRIESISKEKASAELEFLRGQLNPHFFFNSINTLYGTIEPNNELARSILIRLSDMLRYQLYECTVDRVPMQKEIDYINNFVALQKLRSNDRLRVSIEINDSMQRHTLPPLLLAPLVENAFKHISKSTNHENWISISLKLTDDSIHFRIINSCDDVGSSHEGIGLANIRRRLQLIYQDTASLAVDRKKETFHVTLILPHEAEMPDHR